MELNKWFNKGLRTDEYLKDLDKHKENFDQVYQTFQLPADDDFYQTTEAKKLRVIVLAEAWCGHCMLNIPILIKMLDATNTPLRFLRRDENLELMDKYLTNGKSRTIPIFIFINESGEEVAKWGPWADITKELVDELKVNLPEKGTPEYDAKFKQLIQTTSKEFTENQEIWNGVYDSIKHTIQHITP